MTCLRPAYIPTTGRSTGLTSECRGILTDQCLLSICLTTVRWIFSRPRSCCGSLRSASLTSSGRLVTDVVKLTTKRRSRVVVVGRGSRGPGALAGPVGRLSSGVRTDWALRLAGGSGPTNAFVELAKMTQRSTDRRTECMPDAGRRG